MKKYLALLFWILAIPAFAQDVANHAIPIGRGPGVVGFGIATLTDGQLLVGQTGADPLAKTLSGDCTLSAAGAIVCTNQQNNRRKTGYFVRQHRYGCLVELRSDRQRT
jgi:hypothetical protein